jgi:hypothetical protein
MEEMDFEGILRGAVESEEVETEEYEDEVEDDVEDSEEEYEGEDEEDIEDDSEEDLEEEDEEEEDIEEEFSTKKPQSREENARFAEQRRQQQLQQQIEDAKKNSVEYKTAKALADMYGITVEELHAQIEERQLQEKAERQCVTVEQLRREEEREKEIKQTREELEDLKFQLWKNRVDSEGASIQKDYPMLTEEDMYDAKDYLLRTIKNPDMPLEQAVFALHGKKIAEGLKKTMRNEALAEVSGRKKTPSAPTGGKSSSPVILTDDERFIIKSLGISEEDYIKNMKK